MRAVCYSRVSSSTQRERDTIASQLRVLPEFVAKQGWSLVRPVETYVDDGRTAKAGKLEQRTGLAALLRDAALGLFDVVVVVDVDRLTRAEDLAERGLILGALQHAGVRVASAMGGEVMDLNSDHGDLIASLKAYVAAADNRKRAQRVLEGKITAAKRGAKIGGRDPYGLKYDKATRTWSLVPEQAAIVREVFERIAGGSSCYALADDLNRRGVRGPGWNTEWHRGRVYDLVRSRHPVGEYVAHVKTNTIVSVPAIVDESLWQAAQDTLAANRTAALRKTKYVYLLEGLARCGKCGGRILVASGCSVRGGRGWRPARYLCEFRKNLRVSHTRHCDSPVYLVEKVESAAWAAICQEIEDDALPSELARDREDRAADGRAWEQDVAGYKAHLSRLDKLAEGHLDRHRRQILTDEDLDTEMGKINRERRMVRDQIKAAERGKGRTISAQARLREASERVGAMKAKLAIATPAERREIALTLLDPGGVVLAGQEIRLELMVDRPASAESPSGALAAGSNSSTGHESPLRIRVLARVA